MKYVYFFGNNQTDGKKELKDLLGGKGANLAEMANIGVPVPPGFTLTTAACNDYNKQNKQINEEMMQQIEENISKLESAMDKVFGDPSNPLLLSVRSGAAISMPGMMDTILNLGLNDDIVKGLAKKTCNEKFAWDCYRRFIQMYCNVVMGISHTEFEDILEDVKKERKVRHDTNLNVDALKQIVQRYKTGVHYQYLGHYP